MLARAVRIALLGSLLLALSACSLVPSPFNLSTDGVTPGRENGQPGRPTAVPPAPTQPPAPPTAEPPPTAKPPTVLEYNLGEASITLAGSGADDPGTDLPLRLDGLIGVPSSGGPHPLVLILHGDHLSCPPDPETGAPVWPCDREKEQLNYRGFEYLIEALAAQGSIALAVNANGAYTKSTSDGRPDQRLSRIIDLHLSRVVEAAQGGPNQFGVDLYGRVDPARLVWIAHSSAAGLAAQIIGENDLHQAIGAAFAGYGPVRGLLLAAPYAAGAEPPPDLPLAVILPACDNRDTALSGQGIYEAARGQPQRKSLATTVLLEAANHNQFNAIVPPDMASDVERPHCRLDNLLAPQEQQAFLAAYAASFIAAVSADAPQAMAAYAALGLDASTSAPGRLFDEQARLTFSPGASFEDLLLRPASAGETAQNLAGGQVLGQSLSLTFCPPGDALHAVDPALAPCRRLGANHPADPAQLLLTWQDTPAALRLSLPDGGLDLSRHTAVHMRAVPDPISPLNEPGRDLSFSVSLTDAQGHSAVVPFPAGEPALIYPTGDFLPEADGREAAFTGHVQMSELRLPLQAFDGLDLTAVSEVALIFDQAQSGALFIADLGFVRPRRYPGSYSTLLVNDGSLDRLRSIGRFHGSATCTGVLIDTGAPQAPAVVLTNGHCAANWSANGVDQDLPAAGMQMVFNYFANTRAVQIAIPAARVLYSTMKGHDLALIELEATQEELQARDIMPFKIAAQPPARPDVTVIGAPVAELPSEQAYLRREACRGEERVALLEHIWRFNNVYRLDCRDIYGGSSGSPVFSAGSQEIVAVVNTTTTGGETPCSLNAPCEVTASGVDFRAETSYAVPVDGVGACFDENGRFDLTLPDCPLDDGRQLSISGTPEQAQARGTWNAQLSGDLAYYRYKTGPVGETDCRADAGYSEPVALAERPLIDDPLPQAEGFYILCLLAGPSAAVDGAWQPPRFATAVHLQIDTTPPVAAPTVALADDGDLLAIEAQLDPPEIAAMEYKTGPIATADCSDPQGYTTFGVEPVTVPLADLPALLCLVARDAAGNAGQPLRQIIDR